MQLFFHRNERIDTGTSKSERRIEPCIRVEGNVRPPGSKSITNRALICASLARGTSTIRHALDSEDTRLMEKAISQLGINVDGFWGHGMLIVHGIAGKVPARSAEIQAGNSGTTIRFVTALATLGHGDFILSGTERMHRRPIGDLVAALNQLGANVRAVSSGGCPPVSIHAASLPGGIAKVAATVSSQFLSALLMVAPYSNTPTTIRVTGPCVSRPYVRMTLEIMRQFGVSIDHADDLSRFEIESAVYEPREIEVEPDASAASYFFAAAAICGGTVVVQGLNRDSIQGDLAFVQCLQKMGCKVDYRSDSVAVTGPATQSIDVDMSDISDTAQTLSAVALFVEGTTIIRGIGHNRFKETDRIANLAIELEKLGATVSAFDDGMKITPGPLRAATIETHDDHRMAMSLSLAGLKIPGVIICNPECTGKTYPNFFSDLESICYRD